MMKPIVLWTVLLLGSAAILVQAWKLVGISQSNQSIADLAAGKDVPLEKIVNAAPQVRLARAMVFKKQQRYDEALATLNLILDAPDPALQAKIRYNLGNIYLHLAIVKTEAMAINDAMPLVALAKQAYRQALALDSQFWDAKYNLEVAMRLLPEMDKVSNEEESPVNQKSQLWTTVPGFPRGLP
ncbi:MAG: MxaK protein [Methylovulum sp.]|uniref:MxaK protein n=1 Tax=Methylovulum sp. TaxID=1916980 RepID=UPI0026284368|nr:MxaK protein [Methylovulum sp.]MDD2724144.1 MxaK protein [Methylovulum sp.]MDD5123176.1 MxaK protein [Methylovulum sp.]